MLNRLMAYNEGNALGLRMSGTKSPNGADLNRFELVTAKISAAPLGLEIIVWNYFPGRCPRYRP